MEGTEASTEKLGDGASDIRAEHAIASGSVIWFLSRSGATSSGDHLSTVSLQPEAWHTPLHPTLASVHWVEGPALSLFPGLIPT